MVDLEEVVGSGMLEQEEEAIVEGKAAALETGKAAGAGARTT